MNVGTKSILFGDHQFLIHPLLVARAWRRLFGFPRDPRLWACFFVHDLGYWGKPNMDGEEGSTHPELGAQVAHWLFDERDDRIAVVLDGHPVRHDAWYNFCLYHSRFLARRDGHPVSRLALADKLALVLTPCRLFLFLARLCGSLPEYVAISKGGGERTEDLREWHKKIQEGTREWVYAALDRQTLVEGYFRP
jgi:hypothetical protein